jgi:hypothetical protein
MTIDTTTIRISNQTKDKFDSLKVYPRETADDTLVGLMNLYGKIKVKFPDKEKINWEELAEKVENDLEANSK